MERIPDTRDRFWSRGRLRQYAASLTADLLVVAYGLGAGWTSAAQGVLESAEATPLLDGPLSLEAVSWLAAIFCLASVPLGPVLNAIVERWGRIACGRLTAVLHASAFLAVAFARRVALLYVARFVMGVAVAAGFIFAPLYHREIGDSSTRGPLGILMIVVVNLGVLIAYVLGAYCSIAVGSALCAIPPLAFLALSFVIPETPVFLLRKGREDEAAHSLRWLRAREDVSEEMEEIKSNLKALKSDQSDSSSVLKELVSSRPAFRGILLVVLIILNQQFSGLFCVLSYNVFIFQEAGTRLSPYTSSIIVGAMFTFGSIVCVFLINRLGRKTLLLISDIFMALSLLFLGIYFYLKRTGNDVSNFGWLPITSLSVYVIAYSIGLATIPLLVITELFTPKLVSPALTINGPLSGVSSFIVSKYSPTVAAALGIEVCLWAFAAACALGTVLIAAFLPETKGKSLSAVLQELSEPTKQPLRKTSYSPVMTKPPETLPLNESIGRE